jgi:hypothetical protein
MRTQHINWMEVRTHVSSRNDCLMRFLSQDHKDVIRLFTSLAFGSLSQLGFDPTVKRVAVNGEIQYVYTLDGRTYVTMATLFDFRANAAVGRATRVWAVYPKDNPDRTFVLKDLWMYSDARPEGEILHQICKKINPKYLRFFLTVEADTLVHIDGSRDRTVILPQILTPMDKPKPDRTHDECQPTPTMSGSARNWSMGHIPGSIRPSRTP